MMSLIELWRALDSDFYRTSPARQSNADVAAGLIPLMVTRFQRYFVNRLKLKDKGSGAMSGTTTTTCRIRMSRTRLTPTWTCSIWTCCGGTGI